jgi:hypothetical protein
MRALFHGWWDAISAAVDTDKDGVLTLDELAGLFMEFNGSEDEHASGHWLFGPI